MRSSALLTLFTFVAACSARVIVPNRYVVELENVQVLNDGKRSFDSVHKVLYHTMRKRGLPFDVAREYDNSDIFVGASLHMAPEHIAEVAKMPGVKGIHPVMLFSAPKPLNVRAVNSTSSGLPDGQSTHIMTGVDKLHAKGVTGKGIKIGIIDTGIDYKHPSLGGGFGPGFKVAGGYDFVGDAYDGFSTPVPDNDPLDQCNGHGTHVAGIIGANPGNDFGISGVAYDATIFAYRLFGCAGSVSDDIIIDALLRGYKDGSDILTLSLGGVSGWSESSSGVVASRLEDKGVVVTIAQGNDGTEGSWAASSPATGLSNFAIGSVDNTLIPVQNATVHGVDHDPIVYFSALPLPVDGTLPVYATSKDPTVADDACDPLPDDTPDLSEKVVVVRRGTCTFVTKLQNIADKGGKAILIYNNVAGFSSIEVANFTASLISADDGAYLVKEFAAGANISLSFPQTGGSFNLADPNGGLMSDFSTYGPSFEVDFKPTLSAPGGNILSTYPLPLGGWALESGTSMATPFVAGSAALVIQARGKSVVKGIRDLLQSTASPIASSPTDKDALQTLSVAGSGLIQVNAAVSAQTIISPAQLLLNDTAHLRPIQKFTITNTGSKSVTYKLSHIPAGTAASVDAGTIFTAMGPVKLTSDAAHVLLTQSKVTLKPKQSTTVIATFTPPNVKDRSTYPVYSGFIQVASDTESLRVAYLGVANSLKTKQVIDTTDYFFGFPIPAIVNNTGVPGVNKSYTLTDDDQPILLYRLAFGTPLLRLDLVPSNFKPPQFKRDFWSWITGGILGNIKTLGVLFESDYNPRSFLGAATAEDNGWNEYAFNGTLADGSVIKDGSYKVFLRALRVTGNRKVNSDYESWLSPTITIKRK